MLERPGYLQRLAVAVGRSPVTALLGPRQCGKTTIAREFCVRRDAVFFDLESEPDSRHLANPELALGSLKGLVVLDEIQAAPHLFNVLRVLVDRPRSQCRFLILGSASPAVVRGVSESLAGRVEFVEMSGFDLGEVQAPNWRQLWLRGGLPRSYLAASEDDSVAWREGFVHTFLERDIPQLGISIPASALRRFWTMLAHWHGQTWNASEIGRSMSATDKTVRRYLDLLTGTYMMRQLQPWFENIAKRQVKAPKVYFRDTGLLHTLLGLTNEAELLSHPRVGASWEGFAVEQVLQALRPASAWFWAIHQAGELDLFLQGQGQRIGFEMKFSEAPDLTRSTRNAAETLALDHLYMVCPTRASYPLERNITVLSIADCPGLPERLSATE